MFEAQFTAYPGQTDYWAGIYKNDGGVYKINNEGGDTWEAWNAGNAGNYDHNVAESGHGVYTVNFPASIITAGRGVSAYLLVVYQGPKDATAIPMYYFHINWDGSAMTVSQSILAPTGLDLLSTAEPTGPKSGWGVLQWFNWLWRRWFKKHIVVQPTLEATGSLTVLNEAGDGTLSVQLLEKQAGGILTVNEGT